MFVLGQNVTVPYAGVATAALITGSRDAASVDLVAFPANKPPIGLEGVPVGDVTAVPVPAAPDAFVVEPFVPPAPLVTEANG